MELMANHAPARESGHSPTVQLLRIMKLTALMLLAATLTVSARTGAQRVTLNVKNVSLNKIFTEIEKQTGYSFVYNNRIIESAKPVTLTVKASTVEDVLKLAFKGQPFNFQLKDNTIIVIPETASIPPVISIAEPPANIDVHGVVKDEAGKPAAGVSVRVKGTNKGTTTNDNGEFKLMGIDPNSTLVFSSINLETYETRLDGRAEVTLVMKAKISRLQDVEVASISTGYQTIPRERATGSFAFVDNETLNRKVSTNILDRIYDVTPGLYYNPNPGISTANKSSIVIRGRSTINSNPNPLIILDNFPYDGDLSTINPNDIENITVLKDAAASSIWGAFAGNGVIVITSKKGKYNQPLRVSVNANVSIGNKPDLYYAPQTSVSDWIDLEVLLFQKGAYTSTLASGSRPVVSPVVDILAKRKAGQISAADSASQIDAYRSIDTRDDLSKFMYQRSVNQQYSVSLTGGSTYNRYSFSASFDNNQSTRTYNSYQRTVINASNTYALFKQRLELSMSVQLSQGNTFNNAGSITTFSPYLRLTDNSGNSLVTPRDLRQGYKDTVGQGKLLDWNYRPLDEMSNGSNVTKVNDVHLSVGLRYKILTGLDASLMYQYNTGTSDNQIYYSQQTYFTRDLINRYAQINYVAGTVNFIIPLGGILDKANSNYTSQNSRIQVNYEHNWKNNNRLNVLAGSELRTIDGEVYNYRQYGYAPTIGTSATVDYKTAYPQLFSSTNILIPNTLKNSTSNYNYISLFANAAYSYKQRYILSGSIRKDESNIFGVATNQKGVPLYSIGTGWEISKESFYKLGWLPYLKLRVTGGSSGNVNQNVAALATATYNSTLNLYGQTTAGSLQPPNATLRWERVDILNFGLDYSMKNDRLSGSVEYYVKKGNDLIASSPIDPTTGIASFTGNTANMQAKGFDVVLNSKNITGKRFSWNSNFILSYVLDKVTSYNVPTGAINIYTANTTSINPLIGRPLYSILSYQFAGLDSVGNPKVMLDGKVSEAYSTLRASSNFDNLKYSGPVLPPLFGSFRNTFTYKNFALYVNINYKFGYYFRRSPVFTGSNYGYNVADYNLRWQKPGDEKITNIPSLIYPANSTRDGVFAASDALIEKGDNIRLQDIQFSYDLLSLPFFKKLFIQSARFYLNANNVGILWRANEKGLDPDASAAFPIPKSFTLGMRIDF